MFFRGCVFTDLSTQPTTSGGPIFRCTTKDWGERRVKGVATPFNPPRVNVDSYAGRALVLRVRIGTIDAIASSQSPFTFVSAFGKNCVHSLAPPFPTKPTSLGFGGGPFFASALRLFPRLCVLRPDGDVSASPEEVPLGCAKCVGCVSANHSTKVGYCVGYGESVAKTFPLGEGADG